MRPLQANYTFFLRIWWYVPLDPHDLRGKFVLKKIEIFFSFLIRTLLGTNIAGVAKIRKGGTYVSQICETWVSGLGGGVWTLRWRKWAPVKVTPQAWSQSQALPPPPPWTPAANSHLRDILSRNPIWSRTWMTRTTRTSRTSRTSRTKMTWSQSRSLPPPAASSHLEQHRHNVGRRWH